LPTAPTGEPEPYWRDFGITISLVLAGVPMMKVITPEQSKLISAEIYEQACVLDDAADQYQQPCDIIAERLRRLSEKRFAVLCRAHATMLHGKTRNHDHQWSH
jgi:hypothetical protein